MSVIITEVTHYDEFTGIPGGGVAYPNGGVMNKMKAVIDFYSFLSRENKNLIFNAAGQTITNNDPDDTTSFIQNPDGTPAFRVGMTIEVEDTVSNNGTYTIAGITARVITTVEALVNETDTDCSFYDDTPITALDLYYNLIENKDQENYISLTDKGAIQRFTVDGLDATDLVTVLNMLVSSASFGWVTNEITNLNTGETSEVTIIGMGITDHKQAFKITQTYWVAPFATRDQLINFQRRFSPNYFADDNAMKYICKLDAKFSFTDPDIPHTGKLIDTNGLTNWFDQNNIRSLPDYYVESITYVDQVTSDSLTVMDFNKVNDVVVTIKSRNGKFVALETVVVLDFVYIPLDVDSYINTPQTTLRQNFMNDRCFITEGTMDTGEYFGTDYQVFGDIDCVFIDAETIEMRFEIDMSTFLKDILKLKDENDRNYFIAVTTQNGAIVPIP